MAGDAAEGFAPIELAAAADVGPVGDKREDLGALLGRDRGGAARGAGPLEHRGEGRLRASGGGHVLEHRAEGGRGKRDVGKRDRQPVGAAASAEKGAEDLMHRRIPRAPGEPCGGEPGGLVGRPAHERGEARSHERLRGHRPGSERGEGVVGSLAREITEGPTG